MAALPLNSMSRQHTVPRTRSQRVVLAIIGFLHRLFISWEVRGRENVPMQGPLIVVANHVHLVDPVLLMLSFPRWITFMAKEELFGYPFLGPFIRWGNVFPVPRTGTLQDKKQALDRARQVLSSGLVMGLFPEGSRSRNGRLSTGKAGAAVLAARTGTPVVPVGIAGTDKIRGVSWLWKRPRIRISMGSPVVLPTVDARLTRSQARALADVVMGKIAVLLPEEQRGVYENREGA